MLKEFFTSGLRAMPKRPDPRTHQRADMYQGWEDPAPPRRQHDPSERVWWAIVGFFTAFALLLIAQSLGVACAS